MKESQFDSLEDEGQDLSVVLIIIGREKRETRNAPLYKIRTRVAVAN